MRAVAVDPKARKVLVVDHPEPALGGATGVKLAVLEVGICGTDREIVTFQYGTPPKGSRYLVLGHESLAEVVETGPGVTRFKRGDLVVPMVRRPCARPECVPCRAGRQDFCITGEYTERGIKGAHGFMTELVADDESFLHPVPAGLRDVAVLTEPLTIAEKALEQVRAVQRRLPWSAAGGDGAAWGRGHRAVVLGAGPVGLLGAMALVDAGFETSVYSRASGPHDKASLVGAIGATYVAAEDHTVDGLADRVGPIDLVYEATGASRVAFDVMRVLGPNAVFAFTGVPGRKAPVELDTDLIMRRLVLENQVVFGTVNAGRDAYQAAIRDLAAFAARWPDAVRGLITARIALADAPEFLLGGAGGIKSVVELR